MLEPHPARRDPRVLLLDATTKPFPYAALDAWEVRGLGSLPRRSPSRTLERLLLQVRPSHVVVLCRSATQAPRGLRAGLATAARRGLPILVLTLEELGRHATLPSPADLSRAYPELQHLTASHDREPQVYALRLALAVLLHHPLPPRHYAPRQPARAAPAVGHGRA